MKYGKFVRVLTIECTCPTCGMVADGIVNALRICNGCNKSFKIPEMNENAN